MITIVNIVPIVYLVMVIVPSTRGEYDRPEGTNCTEDGVNGTCYNIHRCRITLIEYKDEKKLPQICSFEGDTPVVCCTECEEWILDRDDIPKPRTPEVGDKSREHCRQHFATYQYRCTSKYDRSVDYTKAFRDGRKCYKRPGRPYGVGGYNAHIVEYPHMVLLGYGNDVDSAQWLCAGSIISLRFILTAAHCTHNARLGPVTFVATDVNRRSDPVSSWSRYKVKRIMNHPEYHAPNKYHDIALLEVDGIIKMSNTTLPACLPFEMNIHDGKAFVTGWGANTTRGALLDVMQRVDLERFTDEECSSQYPMHRLSKLGYQSHIQMCYGHRTEVRDSCPGDSGGPLQVRNRKARCISIIVGVTSYGKSCGTLGQPGVYTRVRPYLHWIEGIIWPGSVGMPREGVDD